MLKETYLAMKKRLEAVEPNAEFIVVTRTAHSVLAPRALLFMEFKEKYEMYRLLDFDEVTAHNRAWDDVDYERRFREVILSDPEAVAELKRIKELSEIKDVYLVCYEKPPKKCHRFILLDMIKEMN